MTSNSFNQKITPRQISGTIPLANGLEAPIRADSVQYNTSGTTSGTFIHELKTAIKEGIFRKDNE